MDFSQQEYDTHLGGQPLLSLSSSPFLRLPSSPPHFPLLADVDWSQQETVYLFSLLREYDLRFVIVADRYAYPGDNDEHVNEPGGGVQRTIEDIKSRYYSICRRLVRSRPTGDEQGKTTMLQYYAFDKG